MAGKGTKNNQQNTQGEAQSGQPKQPLEFDVRIQSIKPSDRKDAPVWTWHRRRLRESSRMVSKGVR